MADKEVVIYTCPGCKKQVKATKISSATWLVDHSPAPECKYKEPVPTAGRW